MAEQQTAETPTYNLTTAFHSTYNELHDQYATEPNWKPWMMVILAASWTAYQAGIAGQIPELEEGFKDGTQYDNVHAMVADNDVTTDLVEALEAEDGGLMVAMSMLSGVSRTFDYNVATQAVTFTPDRTASDQEILAAITELAQTRDY